MEKTQVILLVILYLCSFVLFAGGAFGASVETNVEESIARLTFGFIFLVVTVILHYFFKSNEKPSIVKSKPTADRGENEKE